MDIQRTEKSSKFPKEPTYGAPANHLSHYCKMKNIQNIRRSAVVKMLKYCTKTLNLSEIDTYLHNNRNRYRDFLIVMCIYLKLF